ncbi:MAG TPA: EAL domain-containing protein [Haliangiales bacterium]|nr:EAL domain-containing protein [Haliangiales bacterium]
MVDQKATPRARVLVVDDDPSLLSAYSRILRRAGLAVEMAPDGRVACEMVSQRPIDVVVSDISMPGKGGLDVLQTVRAADPDIPVILMTGGPELETALRALELGALKYLVKPIEAHDLLEAVDKAVQLREVAKVQREAAALYSKAQGTARNRAELTARFDRALARVWIAFQPIIRSTDRSVYAFEALVRSEEPTLGRPDLLFQAAEELGRLHDLGRKIRRGVVSAFARAPGRALAFVNLHIEDLWDDDLYDPQAPLSRMARRTVLEITERAALDRPDIRARVDRLREIGFRVALDDLGAGYSGLSTFAQLQPEIVKLDMSLIRGVDRDPTRRKLVQSLYALCQQLGIEVVSEGIETMAERDAVLEMGADLLQGYLYARPGVAFPEVEWP